MVTINEMVENLSIKHSDKLKEVCEPLHRYFGISHFFITKTMADGQFFSIGSHPGFQEYYYNEKKFIWNPFNVDPKLVKPGIYSFHHMKYSKVQEVLSEVQNKVAVSPLLVMALKEKDQLIRFGYSTNLEIDPNKELLLLHKNLHLLNMFNRYFLKEMDFLIKTGWENSISLKREMGDKYIIPEFYETPLKIHSKDRLKFLNDIGIIKSYQQLTEKEFEYLNFIAKGMTCKEISFLLNRSIRTVENHIEAIKNKLNCRKKSDLIEIALSFS